MSCCGKKRSAFYQANEGSGNGKIAGGGYIHPKNGDDLTVSFQYVGRTGLIVRGSATGRNYRFGGTGAIVEIDPSDAPSIAGVPNLVQVRSAFD